MPAVCRVLYVDDEPGLLGIGKRFLEKEGAFAVDTLTSAVDALESLKTERYDVIISDYEMPEMDGIGFLKQLKTSGNSTPFIIFTGRGREEVVIEALNAGADFYLQKGGELKSQFTELAHKIRSAVMMRQTLMTLAEQEQRYHDLQNANDLIQSVAPDGHFLFVNKKWLDTLGYQEQELPDLTVFDIIHEESQKYYRELFQRIQSCESIGIIEATFRTRDGKKIYVEGMSSCNIADGKLQYTRGIYKDVTDLKRAELDLRKAYEEIAASEEELRAQLDAIKEHDAMIRASEEKFRETTNNIPGVVFQFIGKPDGSFTIFYVSDRARDILGAPDINEDLYQSLISNIHPDDKPALISSVEKAIRSRSPWRGEARYFKPSGEMIWLKVISSPVERENELVFFGVLIDISERKKEEEARAEAEWKLSVANQEITSMFEEEKLISEFSQVLLNTNSPDLVLDYFGDMIFGRSGADYIMISKLYPDENAVGVHSIRGLGPFLEQIRKLVHVTPEPFKVPAEGIQAQKNTPAQNLGLRKVEGGIFAISHGYLPESVCIEIERILQVKTIYILELVWEGKLYGSITFGFKKGNDIANPSLINTLSNILENGLWRIYSANEILSERRSLAESEAKFRAMVEQSGEGIIIVDFSGVLQYANIRAWDTIEYPLEKRTNGTVNVLELVSPELRAAAMKDFLSVSQGIDSYAVKYKISTYEKNERWLESIGKKISYKGLPAMLLSSRDVTERRKEECAIKESETKFRTIFENSPYPLVINGVSDQKFIAVNSAFLEFSGYLEAEVVGNYPVELGLISVMDADRLTSHFLVNGTIKNDQLALKRKDGSLIHVLFSTSPITIDDLPATLTVITEITRQKRIEEELIQKNVELHASEERFRELADLLPQVVFETDQKINLTYANLYTRNLMGLTGNTIPDGLNVLQFIDPSQHEEVRKNIETIIQGESGRDHEYTAVRPDGTTFPVLIYSAPIFRNKQLSGFRGIAIDITERKLAEEKLRKSEKKYRDIIENMQDIVYRTDRKGKLTMSSPYGVKLTGYNSEEEMIGLDVAQDTYRDPEERERFLAAMAESGAVENYPLVLKTKDGHSLFVTTSSHYYYDDQGTVLGVEGILHDITKRREAEDELQLLKISVERSSDEIFWLDFEGNILYVNDVACQITGYSQDEFKRMKIFDLDPDFPPEVWEKSFSDLRTKKTQCFTTRHRCRDGVIIDVEILSVYVNKDHREYSFAFVRDITDRRLIEEALSESEEKYRLLLQNANDAVYIHEITPAGPGIFLEVNDRACQMLGYSREELIRMAPNDINAIEEQKKYPGIINKLSNRGSAQFQSVHVAKDGHKIPVEVSINLVFLHGKTLQISIVRDITERRMAEDALSTANHKLTLLGSITRHDINNKLTVLRGYLELLNDSELDPPLNEYLQKIVTASEEISTMIQLTKEYESIGVHAPVWQNVHTLVEAEIKKKTAWADQGEKRSSHRCRSLRRSVNYESILQPDGQCGPAWRYDHNNTVHVRGMWS